MANPTIRHGTPQIRYTPPGESEITFPLVVPFSAANTFIASDYKARWDWWAEDAINREVVTVGPGVSQLLVTIRYDNDPIGFKKMLRHAMEDDVTLTYRRNTGDTEFPFRVVEVVGAPKSTVQIEPDDAAFGGEWAVDMLIRRTDGGTLDSLIDPSFEDES